MNGTKWRMTKINAQRNDEYRAIYEKLDGSPIPIITEDLNLQVKIEQLVINHYLLGYKKAEHKYSNKLAQLKHQRKVYLERVRGLEAMISGQK